MPFSSHLIKDIYYQNDLSLWISSLNNWLELVFVRFLHSKDTLCFFLCHMYSVEGSHYIRPRFRSEELCSISLTATYLHKIFGIFLSRRFVYPLQFICLFVCLIVSISEGISFILLPSLGFQ